MPLLHSLQDFAFNGPSVEPAVGGKWDQRPSRRLPHWPVRSHTSLENRWWPFSHSDSETHWSPPAGDQCSPTPVSCGSQHPGLPQHQSEGGGGGEAALGVPELWPCAWLPQLGPSEWQRAQWEGVSHVQDCGPLRPPLAGLWGRILCWCWTPNSRLHPLWTRVFREVCKVLVSDPAASWDPRISCRLPVLCHTAGWRTELHQIDFPGSSGLTPWTATTCY